MKNLRKEQVKKGMKKNNKGFTMAELLIVVAIIVILMGVAFNAVQNYQRSSTRLEFDGIAKEVFIAAQNHLTTAESQGYLQLTSDQESGKPSPKLGSKETNDFDTKDERYFVYNAVNTYSTDPQKAESVLDLMLPFGAIDETVRAGGSYIIRYQPSSGRVLDVFYSLPGRSSLLTVSGLKLENGDYGPLMTGCRGAAKTRERYTNGDRTGVVGWYGGEEGLPTGKRLEAPEIVVHNEEVLWVEVKENNDNNSGSLKLIITGVTSGAQVSFERSDSTNSRVKNSSSNSNFNVILDDITTYTTSGMHFANLKASNVDKDGNLKSFIPGEDIIIEAVAYNNAAITNVAYSGQKRTNSLFAEINKEDKTMEYVALVENFRHFENLDQMISGFSYNGAIEKESVQGQGQGKEYEIISKARQIKNLIWTGTTTDTTAEKPDSFIEAVKYINPETSSVSIYDKDNKEVANNNCLYPVSPEYKLEYDGKSNDLNHKVSNVVVSGNVDAGLFGRISVSNSEVKNLELIDFTITGTASAGALAGSATDAIITNVLVHNSIDKTTKKETLAENIDSTSGITGGLIGSMRGGSVTGCAAAVYVSGGTNAGGLIGEVTSGTVAACYSGGHTDKATYYIDGTIQFDEKGKPDPDCCIFNVKASGSAGGLIGSSSETDILYSYSTCSVTGSTAGGFVGNASASGSISSCYATGLVSGETEGAFAGTCGSDTPSNCYYYQIINERKDEKKGFTYVYPVDGAETFADITPLDASAQTYNDFSFPTAGYSWQPAVPYDEVLKDYYKGQEGKSVYNLKTVKQLVALGSSNTTVSINEDDLVTTHYGDWPAPEIFVINK